MVNNYLVLKNFVEKIINISTNFIGEGNFDGYINNALQDVGDISNISIIDIFILKDNNKLLEHTYQWRDSEDDAEHEIKNIDIAAIPSCIKEIRTNTKIKVNNINKLTEDIKGELRTLFNTDVKSVLILPFKDRDEVTGFISFNQLLKPKKWSKFDVYLFRMFRDMLQTVFQKYKMLNILKDKNLRYKELFNKSINPIILIDGEGNFIDYNKAALDFFESTAEEICRKKIWDFYPIHLKEEQKLSLIEDTQNKIVENKFFIDDIIKSFVFNKFSIKTDHGIQYYCVGQDITHLKRLEYELQQKEEDYKSLYQYNMDIIFSLDLKGRIIRVNSRSKSIFGFSKKEVIGRYFTEFLPPEELMEVLSQFKNALEGNSVRFETQAFKRSGNKIILDIQGVPIIIYGHIKGVYVIARDVTKMKESDRELKNLLKENQKLLEETIQLDEVKTEFFSNLSHEFKTPINLILGVTQLLEKYNEEKMNGIKPDHIKIIKQNSYRLLKLVNNLVDITRVDANFIKYIPEPYDIVNVVESITLSIANFAKNKNIDIIFDTEVEEIVMDCDVDKIERILLNLISNAIKFTEPGGCIEIYMEKEGSDVVIIVKDNGIGILEDKLEVIFDRFKQVDSLYNRRSEGSGIGLSLVKSFVEMHEGKVTVESEVGVGTKFYIKLPIRCNKIYNEDVNYFTEESNLVERMNIEFSDIYDIH